jgi:hypothetical protein
VAYRIPEDADTQGRIFDLAIRSKQDQEENIAGGLGFEAGSPVKRPSGRFAGDLIAGSLGMNGQFGSMIQEPDGQAAVGQWAQYFSNGPYGPDAGYV